MSAWTCEDFARWLDDGRPEGPLEVAETHARACPRCRAAFAAADAVERALLAAQPAPAAPDGFSDAVMRRVEAAPHTSRAPAGSLLAWVVADPVTMAACIVGLLIVWWREPLWALAVASAQLVALARIPAVPVPDALTSSGVLAALALTVLPLLLWGSWRLTGWSERLTSGRA